MRIIGPAIPIVFDPLVANRVANGVSTSRRLGFCGPMSRPRTVPIAKKATDAERKWPLSTSNAPFPIPLLPGHSGARGIQTP